MKKNSKIISMKKQLLFITLLLCSITLDAQEQKIHSTPYALVKSTLGKGKPNFLEVGSESCHSCQVMGKLLYKAAKQHPTYNISFIDAKKEREAAYDLQVRMIPTQLIIDKDGREVYRHIGVLSASELSSLFKKYEF